MTTPPGDEPDRAGATDADYRRTSNQFDVLTPSERRVAWAVVRSLATASWVATAAVVLGVVALVANDDRVLRTGVMVAVALFALGAGLETKARDLEWRR